jgi:hypothetical protein
VIGFWRIQANADDRMSKGARINAIPAPSFVCLLVAGQAPITPRRTSRR